MQGTFGSLSAQWLGVSREPLMKLTGLPSLLFPEYTCHMVSRPSYSKGHLGSKDAAQ